MNYETLDCCIIPALEAYKNTDNEEQRLKLERYLMLNIGDRESLRILLGEDPEEFANFYPDMEAPELSTEDTIDSFLERFAPQAPPESLAEVAAMPAAEPTPAPQSAPVAASEPQPEQNEAHDPQLVDETASVSHEDYLSPERKAEALVKQQRYTEALEMITLLRNRHPEKAYYMDDQIRFLRTLIANSRPR